MKTLKFRHMVAEKLVSLEKGLVRTEVMLTNVKYETFLRNWKVLALFGLLDPKEEEYLFSQPKVLQDHLWTQMLMTIRQKIVNLSNREDLEQLNRLLLVLGRQSLSWNYANRLRSSVTYEIISEDITLRRRKRPQKRVRTPSSVGSKRASNSSVQLSELQEEPGQYFRERDFVPAILAKSLTPKELGFSPGDPIYLILEDAIREKKTVPAFLRRHIYFEMVY